MDSVHAPKVHAMRWDTLFSWRIFTIEYSNSFVYFCWFSNLVIFPVFSAKNSNIMYFYAPCCPLQGLGEKARPLQHPLSHSTSLLRAAERWVIAPALALPCSCHDCPLYSLPPPSAASPRSSSSFFRPFLPPPGGEMENNATKWCCGRVYNRLAMTATIEFFIL